MNNTTQQVDDKSTTPPNPTGKGGFGDHPENRNPGGWNKEESISYWYNKLGRMPDDEFDNFKPANRNQKIAYNRMKDAAKDLHTTKEITDRTEGKAPQAIEFTNPDGSMNPYNALTPEELRKLAKK